MGLTPTSARLNSHMPSPSMAAANGKHQFHTTFTCNTPRFEPHCFGLVINTWGQGCGHSFQLKFRIFCCTLSLSLLPDGHQRYCQMSTWSRRRGLSGCFRPSIHRRFGVLLWVQKVVAGRGLDRDKLLPCRDQGNLLIGTCQFRQGSCIESIRWLT